MSVIALDRLTTFAEEVLAASGADQEQASAVAEVLVWSDSVGRANQGVWRLPILCKRLSAGLFRCPCRPHIEDRAPAVALIDGDNGIGHFVGRVAADVAIERAASHGVGVL